MRKSKLQAANLEGDADDIEAAFYDALQRGDIDRLMACWADEDDIFCIHPGGPRLLGATAIRATFEAMFADGRKRGQNAATVYRRIARSERSRSVRHTSSSVGSPTQWYSS